MTIAAEMNAPLADRMRPRDPSEIVGQRHLLEPGKPLHRLLYGEHLHSAIFWGPPGTGKTTMARMIANRSDAQFIALSAVMAGVKDIRAAVAKATESRDLEDRRTVLFLDEVHRFNKAQQDAFLPWVEDGTLVFVGATTENPSFELNNALLSRARVYVLKPLGDTDVVELMSRALADEERGLGSRNLRAGDDVLAGLAAAADGDARRALNLLELAVDLSAEDSGTISPDAAAAACANSLRRFDRGGDIFYDQISALHKSVRGSDPDAALYWYARMLDGGCDPHYIARRVVRMASEDIGNADPRALQLAMAAWQTFDRLGSPEGELAIAQAIVFLACAAKSNAVYVALGTAQKDASQSGSREVPERLRNAPTSLARSMGHGAGYRYAHDEADAFAAGEHYFPDDMAHQQYYDPPPRGLEKQIGEKLAQLRESNRRHAKGRK